MKPYQLTEYETQACARYAYLKAEIKRLTEEAEGYKPTVAHCVNLYGTVTTDHGRLAPTPSVSYPVPTSVQFRATCANPLESELIEFIHEVREALSNEGSLTIEISTALTALSAFQYFEETALNGFPFSNRLFALRNLWRAACEHVAILEGLEATETWKKDAIDALKFEGVIKPETNHTVKYLPPLNVIPKLPKVPSRKSKADTKAAITEA